MKTGKSAVSADGIGRRIYLIRGQRVMVDADLAELCGVKTKVLMQAVKRNLERFPEDFRFALDPDEVEELMRKDRTSNLRPQIVTSSSWGGRRYAPYVFTEQGVAMLSGVLRSPRAIRVNIETMRTFMQLRRLPISNAELARKPAALERQYDAQFKVVFEAVRDLMAPDEPPKKRPISFAPWGGK
jgi:ORF6N domain